MAREKSTSSPSSTSVKLLDMKVATEEKITLVGARIGEKVVHLKAHLSLGLHRVVHHAPPECIEVTAETMAAASERRQRKEQEARDKAEWERAMSRERKMQKTFRQMEHDSHGHQQVS